MRIKNIFEKRYFVCTFLPFLAGMFYIAGIRSKIELIPLFIIILLIYILAFYFADIRKNLVLALSGLSLCLIIGIGMINENAFIDSVRGMNASFSGTVISEEYGIKYISANVDNGKTAAKIKISVYSDNIEIGDKISGIAVFSAENDEMREPGTARANRIKIINKEGSDILYASLGTLREFLCRKADVFDASGFAKSILLGDRSTFSENMRDNMRKTGTGHLIAISGIHTTIVIFIFSLIFNSIIPGRAAKNTAIILFGILYAAITGFSPSVMRSAFMISFASIGNFFGRKSDAVTSLFEAASLMVMISPRIVRDVSFLLSFAAVLALICIASPASDDIREKAFSGKIIGKWKYRRIKAALFFGEGYISGIAAVFASLPIAILYFGEFVPLSWIYNIILIPLFTPILVLSFCGMIFEICGLMHIASLFSKIYGFMRDIMFYLIKGFAQNSVIINLDERIIKISGIMIFSAVLCIYIIRPKWKYVYFLSAYIFFAASIIGIILQIAQ